MLETPTIKAQTISRLIERIQNLEFEYRSVRDSSGDHRLLNKIRNEINDLQTQVKNLRKPDPGEKAQAVVYFIGGPWDLVKRVMDIPTGNTLLIDVQEEITGKMGKAWYLPQKEETSLPWSDGLPVYLAIYQGTQL